MIMIFTDNHFINHTLRQLFLVLFLVVHCADFCFCISRIHTRSVFGFYICPVKIVHHVDRVFRKRVKPTRQNEYMCCKTYLLILCKITSLSGYIKTKNRGQVPHGRDFLKSERYGKLKCETWLQILRMLTVSDSVYKHSSPVRQWSFDFLFLR